MFGMRYNLEMNPVGRALIMLLLISMIGGIVTGKPGARQTRSLTAKELPNREKAYKSPLEKRKKRAGMTPPSPLKIITTVS